MHLRSKSPTTTTLRFLSGSYHVDLKDFRPVVANNRWLGTMKRARSTKMSDVGGPPSLPVTPDLKDIFEFWFRSWDGARQKRFLRAIQGTESRPLLVGTMCSGTESPIVRVVSTIHLIFILRLYV